MNTTNQTVTGEGNAPRVTLNGRCRETFKRTYLESLREAVNLYPEMYAWPDKSDANVEVVANRMFDAIERGTFNYDSKAFKITARKLGIKPTRRAILEYWKV